MCASRRKQRVQALYRARLWEASAFTSYWPIISRRLENAVLFSEEDGRPLHIDETSLVFSQNGARQLSNEETRCEDTGLYQLTFIVGDGNQALANATVNVAGQNYLTQADGSVTISGLNSGLIA